LTFHGGGYIVLAGGSMTEMACRDDILATTLHNFEVAARRVGMDPALGKVVDAVLAGGFLP
jgi:hypothetical protein